MCANTSLSIIFQGSDGTCTRAHGLQAVALLLGYTTITANMVAALQPNDGAYVVDTSPQSVHNRVYQCAIH